MMEEVAGDVVVMTATTKWATTKWTTTTPDSKTTWPTFPLDSALCQMACPIFHRAFDSQIPTLLEGPEEGIRMRGWNSNRTALEA